MARELLASSRLDCIRDWDVRAISSGYRVARLARECGVTERHLQRFFLARLGKRPGDWLTEKRLARGASKLQEQGLVKEAAAEAGLSPAHFSRKFTQQYGIGPSAFRSALGP